MKPFEGDTYIPQEILKLKERFGIKSVLETGSQYGFTLKWFTDNFELARGCEVNVDFYNFCIKQGLHVIHTNSVEAIPLNPDMYYLDAHGFGQECPLKLELKSIAQVTQLSKKPVICIHDFYNPNHPDFGYDTYEYELCFEEIEPLLKQIYPEGFDYHYNTEANGAKRGIIFCYPKI